MAIISVKTDLKITVEAADTPKTTLIQSIDKGSGIEESNAVTGFGSELVSNGDFPSATTGWTGVGATLSIDTARLKITNDGAAKGYAHQVITTEVGKTYRAQCDVDLGNSGDASISIGTSAGDDSLARHIVGADKGFSFVATTTTTYINLIVGSAVAAEYTFFDNISAKLTNGLLHMGRATDGVKANERVIKRALNTHVL